MSEPTVTSENTGARLIENERRRRLSEMRQTAYRPRPRPPRFPGAHPPRGAKTLRPWNDQGPMELHLCETARQAIARLEAAEGRA